MISYHTYKHALKARISESINSISPLIARALGELPKRLTVSQ
jgi:hypothetical protein